MNLVLVKSEDFRRAPEVLRERDIPVRAFIIEDGITIVPVAIIDTIMDAIGNRITNFIFTQLFSIQPKKGINNE